MEILREIVIVLHLVGFALLLGAWAVEAFNRRTQITSVMQYGMALAFVTGLALAAPWGLTHDLNYMKIGIKLVILLVIAALLGIAGSKQKKNERVPDAMFWLVGILTLVNVSIAVLV